VGALRKFWRGRSITATKVPALTQTAAEFSEPFHEPLKPKP
jgi:hypothetical protein